MLIIRLAAFRGPALLIGLGSLLGGCGTNTVFDYSIPTPASNARTSFADIATTADAFSKGYASRADAVATSSQGFDLLSIAGAAATVFGIIFRASVPETQALAAGTATSYGIGSYYATRTRATLYYNGASAMKCIASLASQAHLLFTGVNLQNVRDIYDTRPSQQQTLEPLVDFPSHGPLVLSSAVDSINGKVLSASIAASSAPDVSTLRTTMLSQVQDAVTQRQAFRTAAEAPPKPSPGASPRAPTVTVNDIRPQIDFVSNFSSGVTACIAKAGS